VIEVMHARDGGETFRGNTSEIATAATSANATTGFFMVIPLGLVTMQYWLTRASDDAIVSPGWSLGGARVTGVLPVGYCSATTVIQLGSKADAKKSGRPPTPA